MRTATMRLLGHPDHACDIVAEAIVDEYLRRDPESRVRLYVTGGRGVMFVAGDVLSQADFDVSGLIKRTLGSIGVMDEIEPFVSLEQVSPERVAAFRIGAESPITVTGYATVESSDFLPLPVSLARRITKNLHDVRQHDPEWFWLGPDAEVTVIASSMKPSRIMLTVEHGTEPLEQVRQRITQRLQSDAEGLPIEVNPTGARERRGLTHASGRSGVGQAIYGSLLPALHSLSGTDPSSIEKAGAWLARAAAIQAVKKSGAKAVLIQAMYVPGEMRPAIIHARDERGQDVREHISSDALLLSRVMKEWWRPGLNVDAIRWGFAGEVGLPWEG